MDKATSFVQMPQQDFAALGVNDIAYVRTVERGGRAVAAIFAADGTEMAVVASRELAFAAIRQNGLEPLSAH